MNLRTMIRVGPVAAAMVGVAACGRTKGESGAATDRADARALQHDTSR